MSLKLWRYDESRNEWRYERNVEPNTADGWLAYFKRYEPSARFVVSEKRPRKPTVRRPKPTSLVGRLVFTRWHVPGYPVGIPADTPVEIVEVSKQRGQDPRYRVEYRGNYYWLHADAMKNPEGKEDSRDPRSLRRKSQTPRRDNPKLRRGA